ncbi:MAG: hypothetical protein EOO28_17460 [Comamonadaceae bacterium]|nr:MAG: hypothetical protein EOO28_17460 [Comamonadaceae bacterium]
MQYSLKILDSDDASPQQKRDAEARFRKALDESLGDAALVLPIYKAYQRLVAVYGEAPDTELLSDAEREIFSSWQAAETAAVAEAFGPNRYMGDAMYEIGPA